MAELLKGPLLTFVVTAALTWVWYHVVSAFELWVLYRVEMKNYRHELWLVRNGE